MANTDTYPRFLPAGDSAILIQFGEKIDVQINQKAHALATFLQNNPIQGIGETIPGYCTLLVHFDLRYTSYMEIMNFLRQKAPQENFLPKPDPRRIKIPVVYGGHYGPDLDFVAQHNHLTSEEVIRIHSSSIYLVYMIGFTPGFAYLGGLDESIATPRVQNPRKHVPAGSVGIAGMQTGVYPIDSPGGWQLIGHTKKILFDPHQNPPCLLAPGDEVVFIPEPVEEHQ